MSETFEQSEFFEKKIVSNCFHRHVQNGFDSPTGKKICLVSKMSQSPERDHFLQRKFFLKNFFMDTKNARFHRKSSDTEPKLLRSMYGKFHWSFFFKYMEFPQNLPLRTRRMVSENMPKKFRCRAEILLLSVRRG